MAYDKGLAQRIREHFHGRIDVAEKKMFGGLCFMVSGYMCCAVVNDNLMARVGVPNYNRCLAMDHCKKMDFTGKPMKGIVYVLPKGVEEDSDLFSWIEICSLFIASLPPKEAI